MKRWMKVALITILFTIPTFLTGRIIWPPAPGNAPGPELLPFFLLLSLLESLTFGLGMAFLVYGWPFTRKLAGESKPLTWAMYVSILWLLVSWWPHDNLHSHNGHDLQGLLFIEYGFHVTLQLAGGILAFCFMRLLQGRAKSHQTKSVMSERDLESSHSNVQ